MDPRDFQELAERLCATGNPCECRTAINRAYYAAYNVGVEALGNFGIQLPETANAHGLVQRCLLTSGEPSLAGAGRQLRDLYSHRVQADYRLADPAGERPELARRSITIAAGVIRRIEGFAARPEHHQRLAVVTMRRTVGNPGPTRS